ncbi:39S ribosomal protein L38, mitochondrial [Trichogramma pretiosum]|uniref:39S ribosomal protein L38, mitochondrial n=1 Tax=Trichogramma pretiosum TaxID=7493 RepID=UPI0006C9D7FA|nr:39S ribosomal protein L38, mitochondrial [Trichogramma pretiosum]
MAGRTLKFLAADTVSLMQVRYRRGPRGLMPHLARNLQQRIEEMEYKDPRLHYKVNIGFAVPKQINADIRKNLTKQMKIRRQDAEFEKKSARNELVIDLEEAKQDWTKTNGPQYLQKIGTHYGVFEHLFGDAYFYPVVPLNIDYDFGHKNLLARVHNGNLITPQEATDVPSVSYEAEPDTLWTLLLTTPDGNFSNPQSEYCHWFVGNIPGNDISKGEQLVNYMRPIAPKGIGYCRYIFVLYKQDKKIDFSEYKKDDPCINLVERNWNTYKFMKKYQDEITPAGLAFFQSVYDSSLKDFYHHTLGMEEPTFEYSFPEPYLNKQEWFPIRKPFNTYMDKYRDEKQIAKEFLLKRLKNEHPFKFPEPPLKYPNAHPFKGYLPSWYKTEVRKERLMMGRINEYVEGGYAKNIGGLVPREYPVWHKSHKKNSLPE